jgi:hypothetical protein
MDTPAPTGQHPLNGDGELVHPPGALYTNTGAAAPFGPGDRLHVGGVLAAYNLRQGQRIHVCRYCTRVGASAFAHRTTDCPDLASAASALVRRRVGRFGISQAVSNQSYPRITAPLPLHSVAGQLRQPGQLSCRLCRTVGFPDDHRLRDCEFFEECVQRVQPLSDAAERPCTLQERVAAGWPPSSPTDSESEGPCPPSGYDVLPVPLMPALMPAVSAMQRPWLDPHVRRSSASIPTDCLLPNALSWDSQFGEGPVVLQSALGPVTCTVEHPLPVCSLCRPSGFPPAHPETNCPLLFAALAYVALPPLSSLPPSPNCAICQRRGRLSWAEPSAPPSEYLIHRTRGCVSVPPLTQWYERLLDPRWGPALLGVQDVDSINPWLDWAHWHPWLVADEVARLAPRDI